MIESRARVEKPKSMSAKNIKMTSNVGVRYKRCGVLRLCQKEVSRVLYSINGRINDALSGIGGRDCLAAILAATRRRRFLNDRSMCFISYFFVDY